MVNTRARIKKAQQSGATIGSNDDLLIQILLRLPAASILRFKSVSKHWLSLLSDRQFTLQYKKASISPGFFVDDFYFPCDDQKQSRPPFRDLDFYPDHRGITIVQSCNGLLLCRSKRGNQRDYKYYVFNPTTKQFALIPSVPGGGNVRRTIRFMGLAFHQTHCVHYKVVCIRYIKRDENLFQIQIYSSDTRKWKISDESIHEPYYVDFYGFYWHQAFHVVSTRGNPRYLKLDTEELKLLPLPREIVESFRRYRPHYCGESRGHLHLIYRKNCDLQLNVYEMLNDYSGWFVKYQVELDEVLHAYPEMISKIDPSIPFFYNYHLLDVVRGEEEIETFMVIRIARKVIRYNVHDKRFKQILDVYNSIHGPIRCSEVHRYIESIVCF